MTHTGLNFTDKRNSELYLSFVFALAERKDERQEKRKYRRLSKNTSLDLL